MNWIWLRPYCYVKAASKEASRGKSFTRLSQFLKLAAGTCKTLKSYFHWVRLQRDHPDMEMVLKVSVNRGMDCMDNRLTVQPYSESYL
jgi:hypothetical protein